MLFSACHTSSTHSFVKTKSNSTTCCFVSWLRLSLRSLRIRNTLVPRSASSVFCIRGVKTFCRTLTHDAWHYHLLPFQRIVDADPADNPPVESTYPCDVVARRCCEWVRLPDPRGESAMER